MQEQPCPGLQRDEGKGETKNNMEKNDTGRDEECCYWVGECCKISTGLRDLAGPCRGEVESGKVNTFNVLGGKPCLSFLC